jgi:DNA-binding NtrC family response regulator
MMIKIIEKYWNCCFPTRDTKPCRHLMQTQAMEKIRQNEIDLMITDYRMKGMDGLALLKEVRRLNPGISIIVITAYGSVEKAVEAMK